MGGDEQGGARDYVRVIRVVRAHKWQNDDYEPDLSGLKQARRNVDALIEKEELIFQATEKLEAILEYLKKSANQIDIQRDKDGQPIYRSNGEIVDKVVSATQILDQLKADLLAETREKEPHAKGTREQYKHELETRLHPDTVTAFRIGRRNLLKQYASPATETQTQICGYTLDKNASEKIPKVISNKTWQHHFCMICSAANSIDTASNAAIVANRKGLKANAALKLKHAL